MNDFGPTRGLGLLATTFAPGAVVGDPICLTLPPRDMTGRLVPPGAALAEKLRGLAGREFSLSVWRDGRPNTEGWREAQGVTIPLAFGGADTHLRRAFLRAWDISPCGTVAHITPDGAAVYFLFPGAVTSARLLMRASAGAREQVRGLLLAIGCTEHSVCTCTPLTFCYSVPVVAAFHISEELVDPFSLAKRAPEVSGAGEPCAVHLAVEPGVSKASVEAPRKRLFSRLFG